MMVIELPDISNVKDYAWISFAFFTLWLAKSRVDIAIKAMNHNATLIAYKHSLDAHHETCGIAFCFAPEIEDHLIELHSKYDDLMSVVEQKLTNVSNFTLSIDLLDDVYKGNINNISKLNSDASSFLVSYFKFLKRAVRDVEDLKILFISEQKAEYLDHIMEIYHSLIIHGIRAYIELIHTGYESDRAIIETGKSHYHNYEDCIDKIEKNYLNCLGLIKGRYHRIDAAPVIELALGSAMREKYEKLDVTILPTH